MATIAWEEIKVHNNEADTWIVVHGNVYEVTKFLEDHPGGKDIIVEVAGQDATVVFEEAAHSSDARDILSKLLVGRLKGYHNAVQTFDSIIARTAQAEGRKSSWMRAIIQGVLPLVALISLAHNRDKIPDVWPALLQGFGNADNLLMSAAVILLLSVGALCRFVSYVIYVDYGRLDKYPASMRIE
ncbi:cytochrome b5-like heme/steroid binding domain-containing protein [Leptodontidium sp. 2 PMI_412]|nr:cytochrome b5-like heme/steroid binding domain-containing protein [Leptodontidium sp. 2 PMI_412]